MLDWARKSSLLLMVLLLVSSCDCTVPNSTLPVFAHTSAVLQKKLKWKNSVGPLESRYRIVGK